MSKARITVTFTEAEAYALVRLAECASNTWDDARTVLDSGPSISAGYRGIEKLNHAIYGARAALAPTEVDTSPEPGARVVCKNTMQVER